MGVVWQARDERLQRLVAVKQILLQPGLGAAEADEARRRAMREARIAARLQHPNAIAVFDVAEHDGSPCLVMEYLASHSLAAVLAERGSLPAQEVAAIGSQVASALAAAHRAGIVHRDIKPGNILVNDVGVAKITDFGISRAVGDATVTQTGMVAGTPAYLAPEIAKGHDSTSASDVFSLGATLYHAVEGEPPFGLNPNPLALLHTVAVGAVNPPKHAGPLADLLMHLLRPEAPERPSMEQVARDLAAVAAGIYVPPPRVPPAPVPATSRSTMIGPATPATDSRANAAATPTMFGFEAVQGDTPPADGARRRKSLIVVAVVLVLALGGLVSAFAIDWSGGTHTAQTSTGTPPSSSQSPGPGSSTQASPNEQPTASQPMGSGVSEGQFDLRPAGVMLIAFYDNPSNPGQVQKMWDSLSSGAQKALGGRQVFDQYWSQYTQFIARNAHGVSTAANADGSRDLTVDVTYTSISGANAATTKTLRVIQQHGQLLIDADPRLP